MADDLMKATTIYTDSIPPELVEKAKELGWSDEKIKQEWAFQSEGILEYHSNDICEGFEEALGIK